MTAPPMDSLVEELQYAYYTVRTAVSKMRFEVPGDHDRFLWQGFRTCWASAWQKAGQAARAASTQQSSGSSAVSSTTSGASTASITVPMTPAALLGTAQECSPKANSSELPDPAGSGAGAARFLAVLLRTRALTDSQYKALCTTLAIKYPARPCEQDVMSLDHDQVVRVLCGGR